MKQILTAFCLCSFLAVTNSCGQSHMKLPAETSPETINPTEAAMTETETAAVEDTTAVPTSDVETSAPETTYIVEIPETPQTDVQNRTEAVTGSVTMLNNIMVVDSGTEYARALEIFSGSFSTGERYAQALNAYKAALGETVNVFCMVIPTSAAFYMPDEQAAQYGSQLDNYNHIAENLNGVIAVPVYSVLEAHSGEYLYSRTDYHWQPLAAYYAAEQFALSAGVDYAALETYTSVTREGYVGAFYAVNHVETLQNAPDTFTYYKPQNLDSLTCTYYDTDFTNPRQSTLFFENNSISASYTVFVGRDDCILQVDTDVDNDRVLVIFKDSYGNALVPFLTQSFSQIYLCDFRYFACDAAGFMREVGATDLLFAMSTVACTTSGKVEMVEENLW